MSEMPARHLRPGKVTLGLVVSLGSRLTDRDRQIALDCYEHRVLTTKQLQLLHFSGARKANRRLHALYMLRVLDRFRPPWQRGQGSSSYHWVLDEAGAHIVAQRHGLERRELNWRHANALAIASSAKLRHQLEVNEFFARLAHEAAAAGGALTEWYGERTTPQLFNGKITPDGYAVLGLPGCEPIHVLLELDRATEPAADLRDKATRYSVELHRSVLAEARPIVVIAVPTPSRARAAIEATAGRGAPISVAVWSKHSSALTIVLDATRN